MVLINIFFLFWSKFNRIAETNWLKETAAVHYKNGEFQKSIELYEKLLNEYKETDETIKLNLANSYFHLKRFNSAIDTYKLLYSSKNLFLKSTACLQLGVIYSSNNKKELGLNYFKEALKALPGNEEARYNFELLKKEQEKTQKDISDKKKENKNGENKTTSSNTEGSGKTKTKGNNKNNSSSKNNEEGEEGDTENTGGEEEDELQYDNKGNKETELLTSQRLEEMNMNERQAIIILKALKSSEEQYLQQRKKIISQPSSPEKPDW
jgi:Ca-activated chloride channel family protein